MKGETMTLTEISRYFHLNETIQKNREALKFRVNEPNLLHPH